MTRLSDCEDAKVRKHRRSRNGCRNCKLRKVKCDEVRPQCRNCHSFGVLCNYNQNIPDLQPAAEAPPDWRLSGNGTIMRRPRPGLPRSPPRAVILSAVATATSTVSFELDARCVALLGRMSTWMGGSFGGAVNESLQLAHHYPFLMHAALGLAAAHERFNHASSELCIPRTVSEIHHFSNLTILLNRQLNRPIKPRDRDPLWAAASFLSILVFLSFDESKPEEAWPFKGSNTSDLNWLRMSDAKWVVWNLTDPLRPDSIFRCMSDIYTQFHEYMPTKGAEGVRAELVRLCGLDEHSTAENSPYFHAVHAVALFDHYSEREMSYMQALAFMNRMQPDFKILLEKKDPVSLLLLALWYSKARHLLWWIELRARLEGRALCLYLRRYHPHEQAIHELLPLGEGKVMPLHFQLAQTTAGGRYQ